MRSFAAPADGAFKLADGVVRVFTADLLLLPTGLVTAAVLTRVLGPDGYGRFSLAAGFTGWLGLTSTALLMRAAVKFVSETSEWEPVATSVLRWRVAVGAIVGAVMLIAATPIAELLGARDIAPYFRVFALDLFLMNISRAYRDVMTGTGRYREVAIVSAVRWIARMLLMVTLVTLTRSVMAAVVASAGATLVSVLVASSSQRISLRGQGGVSLRQMWDVAAPLLVYAAAMQLYAMVDLFMLSGLGGSARDAGFYGAAQNLSIVPSMFSLALAPLLLATLGRMGRDGRDAHAKQLARSALRIAIGLIPFAALVAGSSHEIVRAVFGSEYFPAAPLLARLFAAGVALTITAVAVAILTAANRTTVVSVLGVAVLAAAIGGHLALIPRMGAHGAATVTLVTGAVGALVSLALVHRVRNVHAYGTALRAVLIAIPAFLVATGIETPSTIGIAAKLALLSLAIVGAFLALGELKREELAQLRAAVARSSA